MAHPCADKTVVLIALFFSCAVHGQTDLSLALSEPQAGAKTNPWQFTVGLKARRLNARFSAPGPINPQRFKPDAGRGDVGLLSTSDQRVVYEDGVVGPDLYDPFSFGVGSVSIQSTSQFTPAQEIGNLLYVPGSYRFHTYSTTASYESKFSTADLQAGSLATGPYAQIRRELAHWEQTALGLSLGWSFF